MNSVYPVLRLQGWLVEVDIAQYGRTVCSQTVGDVYPVVGGYFQWTLLSCSEPFQEYRVQFVYPKASSADVR